MKLILENWRKFTNEAKKKKTATIKTIRGDEEVDISYELGNFFIYKTTNRSKSHYIVTHKPSGNMIPSKYYIQNYGSKYANIKKMLQDIDKLLDSEELSKKEPSVEALKALSDVVSGKDKLNEEVNSEFIDNLHAEFEKIGLDNIPNLGELIKNIEDGEGLANLTKSLQDAGIKPEEMGEKLEQIKALRDEFDEFMEKQEEEEEEREEEARRANADASRESTDGMNAAQAQAET